MSNINIIKFILILSIIYSCDTIVYKKPIPELKLNSIFFPRGYVGTYVDKFNRTDTLFVGVKDFYYKLKPTEDGKENSLSKKGHIGKQLVIRAYMGGIFVNLKEYSTSKYWNTRFIILKNNSLFVYKLDKETDIKSLIYDYSYDNKTKKYIINPTNKELNKLIDNNAFKLSKSFEKINSISYNTKTEKGPFVNSKKVGCLYGNCKNGYGVFEYNNGDVYFGFFKEYKRHGYGEYKWAKSTDYYTGNWDNNNRSGFGKHYSKTKKTLYVGEWKNHVISGYGYRINSDLTTDRGLWQSGNLISRYNYFFNGKYKDRKTQGCVRGNCNNGYGKYILSSNSIYQGFFINGKRLIGEFKYTNGDKYEGEFNTNGKRDGTGFYTYKNGNTYKGQWLNDKKHGFGIFKYKKGKSFFENYNNGIKVSSKEKKY